MATKIQNKTRKERQLQIFFNAPSCDTTAHHFGDIARWRRVRWWACSLVRSFFFPMKKNEQTLSLFQGRNNLYSLGELSLLRGVGWGSEG